MIFVEERLNLGIDYGTVGGPRFNTTVLTDGGGKDCCNANWSQPLGRWQLGNRSVNQEELEYLLVFHKLRSGAAQGFRFKDWGDFKVKNQLVGVGDGSKTGFQCVKTYEIGFNSVSRPITKIVAGTVKVYFNGVQQLTGWTVDVTSGVVTFANPPASNTTITADFEFDVPVRFEQDGISFRFQAMQGNNAIFSLEALSIVELREEPTIALPIDQLPQFLNQTLDLGYDYDTVGGPRFNTSIIPIGAGFEKRDSNWSKSRGKWTIGDRTLKRSELEYFLAFFRLVRGAAVGFNFKDWQTEQIVRVRFESDAIDFRFDAHEKGTGESIFYLSGVNIVQTQIEHTESFSFQGTQYNTPYSFVFTSSNPDVPDDAQIFLIKGHWDSEGTLGTFSTGETPSNKNGFFYNPNAIDAQVINQFGPPILIGTGSSISGTVIEDETPVYPESSCQVTLKFVWS